jgi:8-oxo-dGTP pyrophosphatase MutT (NUDIX family)
MGERDFERIDGETVYRGSLISVEVGRYRYPDGDEVTREIVRHPGAVAIVALDGDELILVRQPREAIADPDSLELPAGKLDDGEDALGTARRELAEEVGLAAAEWAPLISYHASVGMTDEEIAIFLATGLSPAHAEAEENERIEVVRWPLADLAAAIAATKDAKTLIGLLLLRERLRAAGESFG